MALAPLAAATDLQDRGIDTSNTAAIEAFLAAASAAVRHAAGSPISEVTSTVTIPAATKNWLRLPGGPVTEVTSVEIDGVVVGDWELIGERLWRPAGWAEDDLPAVVTVTYTQGFDDVPADIVDLVCSLVGLALSRKSESYASRGDVESEGIDDYRVSYASGGNAQAGVFELPTRTRAMLRSRFGGNGWAA